MNTTVLAPQAAHQRLYREIDGRRVEHNDGAPGFVYDSRISVALYSLPPVRTLMAKAGLAFKYTANGEVSRVLAPDPVRLTYYTSKNDIPVELSEAVTEKGAGIIPPQVYTRIVESEHHAVGTDNETFYQHDALLTDHMLAMAAIGKRIFAFERQKTRAKGMDAIHDTVTALIGRGLIALFRAGESKERATGLIKHFDEIVAEVATEMHGMWRWKSEHRAQTRVALRELIADGLAKNGIAHHHPDILKDTGAVHTYGLIGRLLFR